MTGPEHYREAERWIEAAEEWADADMGWRGDLGSSERVYRRNSDLAAAHVHATLALVAAQIETADVHNAHYGGTPYPGPAWDAVLER